MLPMRTRVNRLEIKSQSGLGGVNTLPPPVGHLYR